MSSPSHGELLLYSKQEVIHLELSGCHFNYAGISSRKYGLIFANANTSKYISMAGNISTVSIFNKSNKRNYFISESFDKSPIQFDIEIVTDNDKCIPVLDRRLIERWLFHQSGYCKLYVDLEDDTIGETYEYVNGELKQLYLNCRFINPEKMEYNGGLVGYKCTIECDSCMSWQDVVTYRYPLDHTSATDSSLITLHVDSDIHDYIYPKVSIQLGSKGGNITISNDTDDASRLTSFVYLTPGTTVTMKGDGLNYISGDNYMKFSDRNFIRLLDGDNKLTVLGNISEISFEFQNRRYL